MPDGVFAGFYPVALVIWRCAMIWVEILIMRARAIPDIHFVEQPPTYDETQAVQRFQAPLPRLKYLPAGTATSVMTREPGSVPAPARDDAAASEDSAPSEEPG